jgi:hypothetical protein
MIKNILIYTLFFSFSIIIGCNGTTNVNDTPPVLTVEADHSVEFIQDISKRSSNNDSGPVENVIFWDYSKDDMPSKLIDILTNTYPTSDNLSCSEDGKSMYILIVSDLNGDERIYLTDYQNCGRERDKKAQFISKDDMLKIFDFLFHDA